MIDFSKYEKQVDLEGLREDAVNSENGEFKDVPHGEYEVSVDKLELGMSKTDKPMIKIWYTVLDGEYEGSKIFQNQLVDTGQKIGIIKAFLESLTEGVVSVKFVSYQQYAELIDKIKEYIDENNLEYALEYSKNKNGYDIYKILEVFEG